MRNSQGIILAFRNLPVLKGVGGRFSELNIGLLHLAIIVLVSLAYPGSPGWRSGHGKEMLVRRYSRIRHTSMRPFRRYFTARGKADRDNDAFFRVPEVYG